MKRSIVMFIGIFIFSLFHLVLPGHVVGAVTYESGTYDLPFELKEAGNNNTSIADGYFTKPAKLIVKNGVNYIQLTTTESDWVKSISGPQGSGTVISESGGSRTVQLEVGDLSNPVNLKMHVVVPEDIAGMEYDNHHSVRADFNTSGVPTASKETPQQENDKTENTTKEEVSSNESTEVTKDTTENPRTGDSSSIGLYMILLVGSVGIFALYKTRLAKAK